MPQIVFENPNSPEQPAKGVYRWFYRNAGTEITIYVGCAGNRREIVGAASTLKRGIQEAQRSCVSSDKGKSLDTDFIVGTALKHFKERGFDCIWQHVSDDPGKEATCCREYRPLLQPKGLTIDGRFRLTNQKLDLWTKADIDLAEKKLMLLLAEEFCEASLQIQQGKS